MESMHLVTVGVLRPLQACGDAWWWGQGHRGLEFLLRKTMAREERSRKKTCVLKGHSETSLEARASGWGSNMEGEEAPLISMAVLIHHHCRGAKAA